MAKRKRAAVRVVPKKGGKGWCVKVGKRTKSCHRLKRTANAAVTRARGTRKRKRRR